MTIPYGIYIVLYLIALFCWGVAAWGFRTPDRPLRWDLVALGLVFAFLVPFLQLVDRWL